MIYLKWNSIPNGGDTLDKNMTIICPEEGSIVEMESLPDGVESNGNWQFIDECIAHCIYPHHKLAIQCEQKKQSPLAEIAKAI